MRSIGIRLRIFFMRQNYAYCMSSAYLADCRGDGVAVADWQLRANEWMRQIDLMEINQ